jgi:hypothetical protein
LGTDSPAAHSQGAATGIMTTISHPFQRGGEKSGGEPRFRMHNLVAGSADDHSSFMLILILPTNLIILGIRFAILT